jgi:hypothetical protein
MRTWKPGREVSSRRGETKIGAFLLNVKVDAALERIVDRVDDEGSFAAEIGQ